MTPTCSARRGVHHLRQDRTIAAARRSSPGSPPRNPRSKRPRFRSRMGCRQALARDCHGSRSRRLQLKCFPAWITAAMPRISPCHPSAGQARHPPVILTSRLGKRPSPVNQTRGVTGDAERGAPFRPLGRASGQPGGAPTCSERTAFPQYWPFPASSAPPGVNRKNWDLVGSECGSPDRIRTTDLLVSGSRLWLTANS